MTSDAKPEKEETPDVKMEVKEEVPDVEMKEEVPEEEVKEEVVEEVKQKEKAPDQPPEIEEDELDCKDLRVDDIKLNLEDATVNAVYSEGVFSGIGVGGIPLAAAIRMNSGLSKGRYLFEVELMQHNNMSEARIGFSLQDSNLFMCGKSSMFLSTANGLFTKTGDVQKALPRRGMKGDIVGLVLNRSETGLPNTVSMFFNGQRWGEPIKLPEAFNDQALFPTLVVRGGAILNVNLTRTAFKPLPFVCRLVGDASLDHICASAEKTPCDSNVAVVLGTQTKDTIVALSASSKEPIVEFSEEFMMSWQEASMLKLPYTEEFKNCLLRLMPLRKRKFIFALGNQLMEKDRKNFCAALPAWMKKTVVVEDAAIEALPRNLKNYEDVTLPTQEEGWNEVTYTNSEKKALATLEQWKKNCKNQTIVPDFKASDKLKDLVKEWVKFRAATEKQAAKDKKEREIAVKMMNGEEVPEEDMPKKEDETKKETVKKEGDKEEEKEPETKPSSVDTSRFTPEDWMLAELRLFFHTVIHAFKEDVEDKERVAFAQNFAAHYYKQYAPAHMPFNTQFYGCKNMTEIVDLVQDTLKIENNLLLSKLDKDTEFDIFVEKTESARQEREDIIGAGDESKRLRFKAVSRNQKKGGAPQQNQQQGPKAVIKGNLKGAGKPFQRPIVHPAGKGQVVPIPVRSAAAIKPGMLAKGKGGANLSYKMSLIPGFGGN